MRIKNIYKKLAILSLFSASLLQITPASAMMSDGPKCFLPSVVKERRISFDMPGNGIVNVILLNFSEYDLSAYLERGIKELFDGLQGKSDNIISIRKLTLQKVTQDKISEMSSNEKFSLVDGGMLISRSTDGDVLVVFSKLPQFFLDSPVKNRFCKKPALLHGADLYTVKRT